MTDKTTQQQISDSNFQKKPDDWTTGDEPITPAQESYIKTLAERAGITVDTTNMTKAEASKKIEELQQLLGENQRD